MLETPFDQANEFSSLGFQNIHLVDLDGALKGDLINKEIIKPYCKLSCLPWGKKKRQKFLKISQSGQINAIHPHSIYVVHKIIFKSFLYFEHLNCLASIR